MSLDKHVILIARQWHAPDIRIDVTEEGIGVALGLSDFLEALATEVGSPAGIFTRQQLADRLTTAATRVTEGMKAETSRVV